MSLCREALEAGQQSTSQLHEWLQQHRKANVNKSTLCRFLARMVRQGQLEKPERGRYALPGES